MKKGKSVTTAYDYSGGLTNGRNELRAEIREWFYESKGDK